MKDPVLYPWYETQVSAKRQTCHGSQSCGICTLVSLVWFSSEKNVLILRHSKISTQLQFTVFFHVYESQKAKLLSKVILLCHPLWYMTLFKHYLLSPPFPTTCPMQNEHKIKGTPNDQAGGCQYHTTGTGIKARIIIINASWPENRENVQMLPPAIFVCWFHIYVFHKRTFFTSQQLSWAPWDAAMLGFLLLKNRKRIGHDITYTCATHADLAHDITDTSQTQNGN